MADGLGLGPLARGGGSSGQLGVQVPELVLAPRLRHPSPAAGSHRAGFG